MRYHTKTFGEWWCRKLNNREIKNDPEIRKLANEAWNMAVSFSELYLVVELFPELRPVKGIFNKIKSFFKLRRILIYWYDPIKGIFKTFKSAQDFINKKNKKDEWVIILKEMKE